uniref:Ufm1-specific protease 2 n=1 Tax=Scophthalmus maximus TaxID=52904 RepID=A0A8D3A673_SCOMX
MNRVAKVLLEHVTTVILSVHVVSSVSWFSPRMLTCAVVPQVLLLPSYTGTILRVRGQLELKCPLHSTDVLPMHKAISETFEILRTQVKSESCVLAVCDSPVVIWPNKGANATPQEITPDTLCEDIHQWIQSDEQESFGKKSGKKKNKKSLASSVISLHLMMEVTNIGPLSAPILSRTVQKSHFISTTLPMDCAVRTSGNDTIKDACERLVEALTHQLCEMEKVTLQHMKGTTLLVPEPLHFLLPEPKGLVTVVYPAGLPDDQLETQRKELHQQFELPEDRPYFRRANVFHFPSEPYRDGYLRNPHLVLTHPTMNDGKPYLVQGIYSYHHYMQDRVDDNGWGCAYRSLQTICSWFQQQGYVEQAVPTHKEIQQALVDAGDKQASFVGSRQWIGSIEVQVVLNQLLGVTSKIMFVSQGSELASKGRELANHFLTEGTPIMIGGGVLAHTILGVAWSETTGQIRYLILDPHYTGAEDLQVITDKGWCGWKGPDFWDQTAYYNLCLPLRPKIV